MEAKHLDVPDGKPWQTDAAWKKKMNDLIAQGLYIRAELAAPHEGPVYRHRVNNRVTVMARVEAVCYNGVRLENAGIETPTREWEIVSQEQFSAWKEQDAREAAEHEAGAQQAKVASGQREWAALKEATLRQSRDVKGVRRSPPDQLDGHYCANCVGEKLAQQKMNMGRRPEPPKCMLCQVGSRPYVGPGALCLQCAVSESVCFACNCQFTAQ